MNINDLIRPRFSDPNLVALNIGVCTELTIASGVITLPGGSNGNYCIDTESDDATDDLRTILGGVEGDLLFLTAENDARTVVLKQFASGEDNILIGSDFSLDHTADRVVLHLRSDVWYGLILQSNA